MLQTEKDKHKIISYKRIEKKKKKKKKKPWNNKLSRVKNEYSLKTLLFFSIGLRMRIKR